MIRKTLLIDTDMIHVALPPVCHDGGTAIARQGFPIKASCRAYDDNLINATGDSLQQLEALEGNRAVGGILGKWGPASSLLAR